MSALIARWGAALPPEVDASAAGRTGVELLGHWSQPHRHYHDVHHLTAVLDTIDAHAEWADDPDAVRLAAWFHDAVYDPRRADNEEASAALAETVLRRLRIPTDRATEVARLVRLTARHEVVDHDRNGELLCDADLAILATTERSYRRYTRLLRREYQHVPERVFRAGRAAALRRLLALPVLYRLPHLYADWEQRARANITGELTLLSA